MKVQIVAHTPVGVFKSKIDEYTAEQYEDLKEFVKEIVEKGTYMSFSSQGSHVTLPTETLRNSAIILVLK